MSVDVVDTYMRDRCVDVVDTYIRDRFVDVIDKYTRDRCVDVADTYTRNRRVDVDKIFLHHQTPWHFNQILKIGYILYVFEQIFHYSFFHKIRSLSIES